MSAATLDIRTPEGVTFSHPLATPVTRFLAWLVDLACISVIGGVATQLVLSFQAVSVDFATAAAVLVYFAVSIGYGIALEWLWRGQTLGKRLLRLRVLDGQGLRLTASQVVIRNLLRFVDSLPAFYLVGGLAMLFSRRAQRLGDFAANTVVVRIPKREEPAIEQLMAGKYNSLRDHPVLAARLRQRVTAEEAAIAMEALLRRGDFEPEARVGLFAELAAGLRERVTFPPEAEEGVSDERYVRNALDVLFRAR